MLYLDDSGCVDSSRLDLYLEANGYAALLMVETVTDDMLEFLEYMRSMTSSPLSEFDDTWSPLPQVMEDSASFVDVITHKDNDRQNTIETLTVDGGLFNFFTTANCIEGKNI